MQVCEKYLEINTSHPESDSEGPGTFNGLCTLKERAPDIPPRFVGQEAPARECRGDVARCPFTLFNYW